MTTELLPVMQADRDAAADCFDRNGKDHIGGSVRVGKHDGNPLVLAFARHRIASARPADSAGDEANEAMIAAGAYVLSEWLNDNAPIGQAMYRNPAKAAWEAMFALRQPAPRADDALREALRDELRGAFCDGVAWMKYGNSTFEAAVQESVDTHARAALAASEPRKPIGDPGCP